jgi:hypothetical protein
MDASSLAFGSLFTFLLMMIYLTCAPKLLSAAKTQALLMWNEYGPDLLKFAYKNLFGGCLHFKSTTLLTKPNAFGG